MELLAAGPKNIIGQFKFRGGLGHQEQVDYDIPDILQNLKIEFRKKTYSTERFWSKLNRKINLANEMMGEVRIHLPEEHVAERLRDKEETIFKYRVHLYGRKWS